MFMSLVCPKWTLTTSRKSIHTLSLKAERAVFTNINQEILKARYVSMTVDLWTDRRNRSFFGVTAHYIDENFFEYKTHVLACKYMSEPHTGVNIFTNVETVIKSFNLRLNYV